MSRHVAVLMGGWSAEREVSLSSGRECAAALNRKGFQVTEVDVDRDIATVLQELKPDVAFNALHGRWGEDGCLQGLLEVLGIAYTHSGVMASSVAMHKPSAKTLFEAVGIRCPEGVTLSRDEFLRDAPMAAPYVIKPLNEGSSVGVEVVRDGANHGALSREAWSFGKEVLVEKFIDGRELTVAVMDGQALAVTDIYNNVDQFYTYEAKYADGGSRHIIPAEIPAEIYQQALDEAVRAHDILGCRGVSRTDFRFCETPGDDYGLYALETNTQPGMTPTSLVPEQARHVGISFEDLVTWMVEDAGVDR